MPARFAGFRLGRPRDPANRSKSGSSVKHAMFGPLRYLYVGSSDVAADLAAWTKAGAKVVWDKTGFDTRVAAARVGEGPLWLVAGHRPAPSILPIFAVADLKAVVKTMKAGGWKPEGPMVEVPDGPVQMFRDPSGNEVALLEETRPNAFGV